jgi:streptogramin lyase
MMFFPHSVREEILDMVSAPFQRAQRAGRRRPGRTRTRLLLEGLEDRCLLSITEFPLPPIGGADPVFIAPGPDGNVWFEINDGPNGLGVINLQTHTITEFATGWGPLTPGPDGNVWFANTALSPSVIGMINPTTHAISQFAIPTASSIGGITTGPDGNLWFTETSAGKIARINPATHAITEFAIPTAGTSPNDITTGPDGNLWFTDQNAEIGTIDPANGVIAEFPLPAGSQPAFIASGSDGNLWFTVPVVNRNTTNVIGMINPSTDAITEFTTPTVGSYPNGITAGSDGNLWFTETMQGAGQIGTINPTTHAITEIAVPYTNSGPWGITAGPDGNLWFADWDAHSIGVETIPTMQMVVTQQPPVSVTAGSSFGLTVQAEDSAGNPLPSFNGTVRLALGQNPGGGIVGGTLSVQASGGVATFSGLTLNKAASGYTLYASRGGFASGFTNAITVTPAAATQLVITQQPPATVKVKTAFSLKGSIEDQYGNVVTTASNTVSVAFANNPTGATLGGTLSVSVSNGVATFSNLTINKTGSGYTLRVSSSGLSSAVTNPINVTNSGRTPSPLSPSAGTAATDLALAPLVLDSPDLRDGMRLKKRVRPV